LNAVTKGNFFLNTTRVGLALGESCERDHFDRLEMPPHIREDSLPSSPKRPPPMPFHNRKPQTTTTTTTTTATTRTRRTGGVQYPHVRALRTCALSEEQSVSSSLTKANRAAAPLLNSQQKSAGMAVLSLCAGPVPPPGEEQFSDDGNSSSSKVKPCAVATTIKQKHHTAVRAAMFVCQRTPEAGSHHNGGK
jgi:hypothetical protein